MVVARGVANGGIGGEIAATIAEEAFEWLDAPILRVASIDTPVPYSPPLEDYYCRRRRMCWMRRGSWQRTERSEVGDQKSSQKSEIKGQVSCQNHLR